MTVRTDTVLTTRSGLQVHVRPASPDDLPALEAFFNQLTPEDLRFRFLGTVKVGQQQLTDMTQVDHDRTESFIATATEDGPIIATAMLACDADMTVGEVAVSIRADYRHRGIGWELLGFMTELAAAKGVKRVLSLESRLNRAAIELEQERGFRARAYDGDASLVLLEKSLAPASPISGT